ncbi:uncharacterized protein ASCRUDRAFT_96967 [Ascoidea rubescens DSM 1968]|uniref:Uncharacterized protein n=1 Tax=Ascoidea rubescens DSM 1968 TaxID=1344418 RepID=A0A1D2VPM4_9ASCO|nr:hypothetical protein ASCRUDRAFT_96967 [Ascoidea rubescens DSM 1968]ODV63549.1 hypothetical protein ASCRUDRAFT_96967 [Ascoidea rubescens DSM 1968]
MFWRSKEAKQSSEAAGPVEEVSQHTLNLPDDLLQFLQSQTPRDKIDYSLDLTEDGLSNRHQYKQTKQVKLYLESNPENAVMKENCSLVQQRIRDCIKSQSALKSYRCLQMTELYKECLAVQEFALKDLGYNRSQSVEQAEKIQGIADDLYVKYYGEQGEIVDQHQRDEFCHEVAEMKYKIWDSNIRK